MSALPGQFPARPRRRLRLIIGIALAVAVGAGAAIGITFTLASATQPPQDIARDAGRAIAAADGITYTGRLRLGGAIQDQPAQLTVTRAGTVTGTYTQDEGPVAVITIAGTTYLKAPAAFWTDQLSQVAGQQAGGRWALATAADTMSTSSLTPAAVARALETAGPRPQAVTTTLAGTSVLALTTGGIRYDITTAAPHRLVHVTGASDGADFYSFAVRPLTAATISPVYAALRAQVPALRTVALPAATITAGAFTFPDCATPLRCQVAERVTVTGVAGRPVLVQLTVAFVKVAQGPAFATCAQTVRARPGVPVTVSCTAASPAFTRWVSAHPGKFLASPTATAEAATSIPALLADLAGEQP
jgi:hypothetical protein